MGAKQQDSDFTGQPFPGTGGDFVDGNDVEGHRTRVPAMGPSGQADGEEAARRLPAGEEQDVEGHRTRVPAMGPSGLADGEEAARRWPSSEEQDVEGHRVVPMRIDEGGEDLYRNLPTTQGEIVRRGPGDNPHGER